MNQPLYIIDFQTMPKGFALVLDRLRGVVGVICRPVGVSGKRCEEFFLSLWGFLDNIVAFLAVSKRLGRGLEASWKRQESVLETSWSVCMDFFPVFEEILQSLLISNRFDSCMKLGWNHFSKEHEAHWRKALHVNDACVVTRESSWNTVKTVVFPWFLYFECA